MYEITVRCEKAGVASACGYFGGWRASDLSEPRPAEWTAAFAEHGWIERDGKHYCQRHDPANEGELVQVGLRYVELAPGVRARWPGAAREGDYFPIEVQRDEDVLAGYTAEDWERLREFAPGLVDAFLTARPVVARERVVNSDESCEKLPPEQWCERYGVNIIDPDGWRSKDAPDWTDPITLVEFYQRATQCTVRNVASVDWKRIARDAQGS